MKERLGVGACIVRRIAVMLVLFVIATEGWKANGANLVQNGGFEDSPDFVGWTASGNVGGMHVGFGFAHSGAQELHFFSVDEFSYASQSLATSPGQTYLLSFWIYNDDSNGDFTPNEFVVQWGGVTVTNLVDFVFPSYVNVQLSVTASGNSTELKFGGLDDPATIYLDDISVTPLASIAGRRIFYNNSSWDGNNAAANANDDAAIAIDKTALLPGVTAKFTNYTSYSKGINGIMVDIANLAGIPTTNDFIFKSGNNSTPAGWTNAHLPTNVTVRAGAGTGGSDRVTLIWADGAIRKQWLQITVLATTNTGLSTPDVFYFGNGVGESGNSTTDAAVSSTDAIAALDHLAPIDSTIDNQYDFNRDKRVTSFDAIIALDNLAPGPFALQLITVPGAAAPAVVTKSSVQTDARLEIISVHRETDDSIRVWLRHPRTSALRLWRSTQLRSDWQPVPADWIVALRDDVCEVHVPRNEAGAQSFFRCDRAE